MKKAKVVPFISTKGSVGKTVLAIHIAGFLASQGKKVLLIDADSQQSLSKWFDYLDIEPDEAGKGFAGFGAWYMGAAAKRVIHKTANSPNIGIIANDDPHKLRVSQFLRDTQGAVFNLGALLVPLRQRYDYIFIDTEGMDGRDHAGSSIQDTTILCEPDLILSVTKSKYQFASENERVAQVYNAVVPSYRFILKDTRPPLKFIVNEHDRNLRIAAEVLAEIKRSFTEREALIQTGAQLLDTIVPFKKLFFEDWHNKKKCFMHDYHDPNLHDPLPVIIRQLCTELFPELEIEGGLP